jgi:hypothetical protein
VCALVVCPPTLTATDLCTTGSPSSLLSPPCCSTPQDAFQGYCQSVTAFSIKRGGILYGTGACA